MSLRKAIDARCKQCIYDPYDNGTWRMQVERCTSPSCALFEVRPLPIALKKVKKESISVSESTPCESMYLTEEFDSEPEIRLKRVKKQPLLKEVLL